MYHTHYVNVKFGTRNGLRSRDLHVESVMP